MVGKTLGHYRILKRLGRGGAGDVYLAEDAKLNRRVALKILKPALAGDEMLLLSFKREAQALAALSHPGVVTVYSVEEVDGANFLTMELIEGQPLRQMLPRNGMRLDTFLRLALPLADALAAAHEQGIVHRDFKPRNVMVTPEGRVKVVDFGLAKLRTEDGRDSKNPTQTLFRKGEIRGTIPYMSPEQVVGKPCGPPSDVFSLGTTYYMMLAGRRPFDGKTAIEIISRIVRVDPEPLSKLRPDLPRQLTRIVRRCLAKDVDRRYDSARQVHHQLLDLQHELEGEETTTMDRSSIPWLSDDTTTIITIPAGRRRLAQIGGGVLLLGLLALGFAFRGSLVPSRAPAEVEQARTLMAVLPFLNLSGDPEQAYLSDGLTEEIATHLGKLEPERLGVIARTSVMRFKEGREPIDAIGEALGVDYVVEGSVRESDEGLHVTAKLIEVEDQTQLWSESYDKALSGVRAIQADVAHRIAASLASRLLPDVAPSPEVAPAVEPRAYEAYLRAWHLWNQVTPEALEGSVELFERAIAIEPDYSQAWHGLAAAYHLQGSADFMPDLEVYPRSKEAALRALELDPTSAEAQAALAGVYFMHEWDWAAAEEAFLQALELQPNSAFVRHRYALFLSSMGRHVESLGQMRLAVELDPMSPLARWNLAMRLWLAGQGDAALAELESLPELAPGFGTEVVRGLAALLREDYAAAVRELEKAAVRAPETSREILGYAYGKAGRLADAERILTEMEEIDASGGYVPLIDRVAVHGAIGQADEAFALLEEAYAKRDDALVDLKPSLLFEPLRADPRYRQLLRRMRLPED